MKKYIILLWFCVWGFNKFFAQSTGYMGKRVLMGYGFNTSPAFFGANANNETILGSGGSAETGSAAFNFIHEGFLEVAPSSKLEIGFSVRYYNTVYDNARPFLTFYNGSSVNYVENSPSGYYQIRGLSYTLYMRYFGSRYIAPWGRYFMFGPVINTVKATYDPSIMKAHSYDNYTAQQRVVTFGATEQTFSGFNFMFGLGRSRIIANRVTVDYGFNTQLISLLTTLFDIGESGLFVNSNVDHTNYIEMTNKKRVRGVNRFNVFLKVGVLLF